MMDWPGFGDVVSIERPLTKLWVCTHCGAVWEMLPNAQPPRGFDGQILCDDCNEHPSLVVEL